MTQPLMRDNLITLLRRKWATPLIALKEANCLSLSQRCGSFKREGYTVLDKWVTTHTGKRVKAYRIVGKRQESV